MSSSDAAGAEDAADAADASNDVLSDVDDEEVLQEERSSPGKSRDIYIDSGNEKKVLYLLCIGLNRPGNTNEPLFSFETEPWSLLPKTSMVRPRNAEYVNEIVRRATLLNTVPIPRPRNWNRVQKMEWLQENPICHEGDIEFLTNEVLRVEGVLIRKAREQLEMQSAFGGGGGRGHWRGSVPYLRLIMCLTQDNVKLLFLTRANSRSRQELDARNSNSR
jgi:hypothetical protein